jgi:hypothetical protein
VYIPKKMLIGVLALVSAALVGYGTWAGFNAQATNPSNTFSNGTLVLSVKKGTGTACLSTGGGTTDTNANGSCDVVFTFKENVKKPGDSAASDLLTVKNDGSISAGTFKLFSTSCANADNAENYHGTGNPCSKIQIYVQQFSDSGGTTASACLYGGGDGTTCDFSDATKTIAAFASAYSDASGGLSIGSGLGAGGSNYFKIGVKLPSDANNTFQGRKATWDVNWYLAQ